MQITTIGLDIAKNVFQVHGIDAAEKVVVRKQLRRGQMPAFFKALPPCLVGMEACATSHYWAREPTKLGHQVRLMPAKDVKAYVKRNKNDAAVYTLYVSNVTRVLIGGGLRQSARPLHAFDGTAEAKSLADEQLEVLPARPMIVDCRAQAVMAMHGRVGHGGEALLLQSQHDLCV
jgi:hypothetical protein